MFNSFIILPIQRIPRYKMLLEQLLKQTGTALALLHKATIRIIRVLELLELLGLLGSLGLLWLLGLLGL
jgi:hypothetical protein